MSSKLYRDMCPRSPFFEMRVYFFKAIEIVTQLMQQMTTYHFHQQGTRYVYAKSTKRSD